MTHAELSDLHGAAEGAKHYGFYGAMLVRESLRRTREVLTDYPLLAKMIPYIDRSDYDAKVKRLTIEGGIWKFRLRSIVQFEEMTSGWIRYRVVGGHFQGMTGNILFENAQSQGAERGGSSREGTLVFFDGGIDGGPGSSWPPRLIIERGAEIVFGFTGKRMRSYIESKEHEKGARDRARPGEAHGKIPHPRSRL